MNSRKLYIQTIGCQMNVYDSGRIARGLSAVNYRLTGDIQSADLVIVNTCAIRGKAEQKVFSAIGRLGKLKQQNPALLIGVGGCVAQQQGEHIVRRHPYVDLVFGPDAIGRLPAILRRLERDRHPLVDTGSAEEVEPCEPLNAGGIEDGIGRFVTVMKGCDNFCSYCVVPYVRGREKSRRPERIIAEIGDLVGQGVREVTLLGQNVNSYGRKEGLCSFAELLAGINKVEGLARIRFTTSHPKDLSPELCRCFADLDKLGRHIHLPVQSGSDEILRRMNRRYNYREYLDKIEMLRKACPDIAVTSDFIVGFPGESESDFRRTLDLMRTVRYDGVFAFKYSDRPEAPASRFADKVPEREKEERLKRLLDLQETITLQKYRKIVGSRQEVLVEGLSRKRSAGSAASAAETVPEEPVPQWTGRTTHNRIVNFETDGRQPAFAEDLRGRIVRVHIDRAMAHSLRGRLLPDAASIHAAVKGDNSYAA